MKFSIITATFNSEKTIVKTLNSILIQNVVNELFELEHIIIDGASRDSTISIIEDFREKYNTKGIELIVKSENDSGIYDAWNKGLKLSSGEWIAFLGSDDFYLEDALEDYTNFLSTNNSLNYDLVYSNVKVVDGFKTVKIIDGKWSWKVFKRQMNIAHVGSFHNKKYFEKYGLFDSTYKIAGDYEFLLRSKDKLKTHKIDKITAIMEAGGISNNQISKVFKETLKAKHKTAKLNSMVCYYDYVLAHFKYYLKKALYAIIR